MAASTKNFLSLLALVILVIGTFCTVMVIFSDEHIVTELYGQQYYLIGQAVSATLVVFLLLYLTATSTAKASAYKVFIMFILLTGLIAEIILMNMRIDAANVSYGKYVLISFNFLYRAYCILEYIQEPWAELTFEGINSGIKSVVPTETTSSDTTSSSSSATDGAAFKAKWGLIATQAKTKAGDNFNGTLRAEGEKAVSQVVKDGGPFTNTKLGELAKDYLKNKDGSTIGVDIPAGGKRGVHKRR